MERLYLLGNHAIANGLYESGVDAVFAYPGTPSSEIVEKLIQLSEKEEFYVEWSINEKVAYERAYGVAISGGRSACIMKHVGLNVASDPLITSAYTGIEGGMSVVVADDPFAHSSQNEQDTRRYSIFGKIPCFEPSSPQEAKDMVVYVMAFSEKFKLPVILRSVTRISHAKSDVIVGRRKKEKRDKKFIKNPSKYVMVPANARKRLEVLLEKYKEIKKEVEKVPYNILERKSKKIGIIASGVSYLYVKELIEEGKKDYSLVKVSTYPIPEKKIGRLLKDCQKVFIFEEGDPVIEEITYKIAKSINPDCKIYGKLNGVVPACGELSVEKVEESLSRVEGRKKRIYSIPSLPPRAPVLCPGCPHLGTFYILKKTFGKSAIYPGDIGCYTLGIQMGMIDTCLCMGAGIGVGSGISIFEKEKVVSIIGDSTFFHAGIPPLINASYNPSNLVIAILDNRTTAMTGHQPHPGTGITAKGKKTLNIDMEKFVKSCGIDDVITVDPYKIKASLSKIKKIKDKKGVRVIIFRRACVLLEKKGKRYTIDSSKCKGCRLCLELGCYAIEFKEGKANINVYCNGCGMCAEICPFGAINEKKV